MDRRARDADPHQELDLYVLLQSPDPDRPHGPHAAVDVTA